VIFVIQNCQCFRFFPAVFTSVQDTLFFFYRFQPLTGHRNYPRPCSTRCSIQRFNPEGARIRQHRLQLRRDIQQCLTADTKQSVPCTGISVYHDIAMLTWTYGKLRRRYRASGIAVCSMTSTHPILPCFFCIFQPDIAPPDIGGAAGFAPGPTDNRD
jgi:hypothetical protein